MGRQEAAEVGEVRAADGGGERRRHAKSASVFELGERRPEPVWGSLVRRSELAMPHGTILSVFSKFVQQRFLLAFNFFRDHSDVFPSFSKTSNLF